MNKEEILEKSRTENKNRDIYEQEVLLVMAVAYTILVSAMSGGHIYNLIASSAIL